MSDDSVRAALRSDKRLVVIEAPAGCGKTHQGADYAREIANAGNGRLLILTHTHAACSVFAERTRGVYDQLIAAGYTEYDAITTKHADGYYGWEDVAPFDKVIVTCGVDHIPPPLLQQLKPGGIMVIPIGPPGAQHVLRVTKEEADGSVRVARSDIFGGRIVAFVPLTKLEGDRIAGTHNR